jgi:hypothetical protein
MFVWRANDNEGGQRVRKSDGKGNYTALDVAICNYQKYIGGLYCRDMVHRSVVGETVVRSNVRPCEMK